MSVVFETSLGNFEVELFEKEAPISAKNFQDYVDDGFFDGLIFHRVIPGFMIQGGGFEPGMKQKATDAQIQNEAKNGLKNDKYMFAMARTNAPHFASSQFFINTANNGFLNNDQAQDGWGYAVFGKVVAGMDIVDKIGGVKTGRKGFHDDVPVEDVSIVKAEEVQA